MKAADDLCRPVECCLVNRITLCAVPLFRLQWALCSRRGRWSPTCSPSCVSAWIWLESPCPPSFWRNGQLSRCMPTSLLTPISGWPLGTARRHRHDSSPASGGKLRAHSYNPISVILWLLNQILRSMSTGNWFILSVYKVTLCPFSLAKWEVSRN